jgi:hypothetical protein
MDLFEKYPDIVDADQPMNSHEEYVEYDGAKLEDGMVVLLAEPETKTSFKNLVWETQIAGLLETNRWCTVSEVEIWDADPANPFVTFIGIYEDGTKRQRSLPIHYAWLVKKDSVRKAVGDLEATTQALCALLDHQATAEARGEEFDPDSEAEATASVILSRVAGRNFPYNIFRTHVVSVILADLKEFAPHHTDAELAGKVADQIVSFVKLEL